MPAGGYHEFHVPTFGDEGWTGVLHVYIASPDSVPVELKRTVVPFPPEFEQLDDEGEKRALQFVDNKFLTTNRSLSLMIDSLEGRTKTKRAIARILTFVVIIGGLAIAGGVTGWITQAIGITVAAVAGLERLFSNHKRLLAETQARNALQDLRLRIIAEHDAAMPDILKAKDSKNPLLRKRAIVVLTELVRRLDSDVRAGLASVKRHLDQTEVEALKQLEVDYAMQRRETQRSLSAGDKSKETVQ